MTSNYLASALILVLVGCAAVNPNPNVGMRATDLAFKNGDCQTARSHAEQAALRGEPWAQFRMGALLIDESCPNRKSSDLPDAVDWLRKAACYNSQSPWERGSDLAMGPTGYYNARASSTRAATMLAELFLRVQRPGISWYYITRARSQYSPEEDGYNELSRRTLEIESLIGPEQIALMKKEKQDLCAAKKFTERPLNYPSDNGATPKV